MASRGRRGVRGLRLRRPMPSKCLRTGRGAVWAREPRGGGQGLGTPRVRSLRILGRNVYLWFPSCFEHQCGLAPERRAEPGPERGRLGLGSRMNPPPTSRAQGRGAAATRKPRAQVGRAETCCCFLLFNYQRGSCRVEMELKKPL